MNFDTYKQFISTQLWNPSSRNRSRQNLRSDGARSGANKASKSGGPIRTPNAHSHPLTGGPLGAPLEEEYLGVILLQGLPDSYEPMIMALENSAVKGTGDLVKQRLLQDTSWSGAGGPSSSFRTEQSAMFMRKKFNKVPKKVICWDSNQEGYTRSKCPRRGGGEASTRPRSVLVSGKGLK